LPDCGLGAANPRTNASGNEIEQPRLLTSVPPGSAGKTAAGGGKDVISREDEYKELLRRLDEIHSRIEILLEERSGDGTESISPQAARAALASSRFRLRRQRFFGETLFGDPAWEILTELYLAEAGGSVLPAAGIATAAPVPKSTAYRWIQALTAEGWIVRCPGWPDPDRFVVRLSDKGRRSMNLVFSEPKILTLGG
jgi:hypothetical protein